MRALVFGGLHHVGAHVVAELRACGHDIAIIDTESELPVGESDTVSDHIPTQLIRLWPKLDADTVRLEFDPAGFDVLILCGLDATAGDLSTGAASKDLETESALVNRLLQCGPRAVVLTSSAFVYAPVDDAITLDETSPVSADTRAGAHALEMERAVIDHATTNGASFAILRTSIVAGSDPGVVSERRLPRAEALVPGLEVTSVGYPEVAFRFDSRAADQGPWLRDFVHVSDVAVAHRLAAELVSTRSDVRQVLNVASAVFLGIGPALDMRLFPKAPLIEVDSRPAWRTAGPVLDNAAARRVLSWSPVGTPESIVRSELEFVRKAELERFRIGLDVRIAHEYLGSSLSPTHLSIRGVIVFYDRKSVLCGGLLTLSVGEHEYAIAGPLRRGLTLPWLPVSIVPYTIRIPRERLDDLSLQNPLRIVYRGPNGSWFDRRLSYSVVRREPTNRRSRFYRLHDGATTLFLRQSKKNRIHLTMRAPCVTDDVAMRHHIGTAWLASIVWRRPLILVYEKECAGYEESGAAVFEALVDRGRKDVRFVLERTEWSRVPEKYRRFLVPRFSWEHFHLLFSASTLLGTESPAHAAELRTSDRRLLNRLDDGRFDYVFLQHGVMYMVALSSTQRAFFRAGNVFPPGSRIVASSVREARHLIDQGGFPEKDVYVCGLPKFDHAVRYEDASAILITPTWQPWEANCIRTRPVESLYYRMLHEMLDAVPPELHDRTWILPHRLFRGALEETDLADRLWAGGSYDEALRSCSLLLTDYSSIAYDAFYRGASVVFWWKHKDYCMQRYGGHLMLDEQSAFGPVCHRPSEITSAVSSLYGARQEPEYVDRFGSIVEFHDGRNTERLLGMLERDGLI